MTPSCSVEQGKTVPKEPSTFVLIVDLCHRARMCTLEDHMRVRLALTRGTFRRLCRHLQKCQCSRALWEDWYAYCTIEQSLNDPRIRHPSRGVWPSVAQHRSCCEAGIPIRCSHPGQ